jgi:hypothetical protein
VSGEGGGAPSAPAGGGAAPGSAPAGSSAPSAQPSAGAPAPAGGSEAAPAAESGGFVTIDDLRAFAQSKGGKIRVKANGADQDVDIDEGIRYLSLGRGAHRHLEEGTAAHRKAEQIMAQAEAVARRALEAPEEILDQMDAAAADAWLRRIAGRLREKQKLAEMPAEQRRIHELEREVEQLRRTREAEETERRQAQEQAQEAQLAKRFQRAFDAAMTEAGIPAESAAYRRQLSAHMARIARQAIRTKAHDMTVPEILEIARAEMREPAREVYRGAQDAELLELLGPETLDRLIAARAQQRRPAEIVPGTSSSGGRAPAPSAERPSPAIHSVGDYSRFLDEQERNRR